MRISSRLFVGPALLAAAVAAAPAIAAPAAAPAVVSVMETSGTLRPGEYLWAADGVPPGKLAIVVDLRRERLYVYRGGVEIGRTLIIYGADHLPTPTGRFPILQKDRDHVSNLYDAPMPYMLRLTWDGVAIHGSGEDVDGRYATHGCIGVPDEFAALIYGQAKMGDVVVVTRDWMPEVYGNEGVQVASAG
ncbi:L,D-transpeptidase family protein [Sphingomonas sp. ac-8]|uniref:L,D-transpeptidase family protein n=1 Tax=Sphingomonas sp. ac-8 TaxID=3242977 RepID=UPI003A812D65